MAVLGSNDLRALLPEVIDPYKHERITSASYELSLGNEVFVSSPGKAAKQVLDWDKDQCVIEPGQFALLLTAETVSIPRDKIAFISVKAGIKFRGLVNVSGFHVDPGFRGRLKFAVYNAGSTTVTLDPGQQCFQIWFLNLTEELSAKDAYSGKHQDQLHIRGADVQNLRGIPVSPQELKESLSAVEGRVDFWAKVASVVIGIVVALGVPLFLEYRNLSTAVNAQHVEEVVEEYLGTPAGRALLNHSVDSELDAAVSEDTLPP